MKVFPVSKCQDNKNLVFSKIRIQNWTSITRLYHLGYIFGRKITLSDREAEGAEELLLNSELRAHEAAPLC